jgi:putative salt-induced outer membrane protein YdiY
MRPSHILQLLLLPCLGLAGGSTLAEEPATEQPKPPSPWSNSTELSLVWTGGNSKSQTLGIKDTLGYKTKNGRSRFRIDALRTYSSDDPFYQVDPGVTFEPGSKPLNFTTHTVYPDPDLDVDRYFAEGRYDGNLGKKKSTWNAGASWDRNEDAGIVSRAIVFGGLGNVWHEREDLSFYTSYGLSYTDRQEDVDDPEHDRRFLGVRLSSDFKQAWGKSTIYDNDFTFNVNVSDLSDFNADLVQGVSVSMSKSLSLKISLQLTYAGEPALENVDVIVRAVVVDPDGIPGNGDEFFETVSSGGSEITLGEDTLRKRNLDTIFRTSLQITF